MHTGRDEESVAAKILAHLHVQREPDYDTNITMWFSAKVRDKVRYFQIPKSFSPHGYTTSQLEAIELELIRFDIDLLPLD